MDLATRKECCARVLEALAVLKEAELEKEELEEKLLEVHRLIVLLESTKEEAAAQGAREIEPGVYAVGDAVVRSEGGRAALVTCSIPGVAEHLKSSAGMRHTETLGSLVEYAVAVQKNRVCAGCMRKSSMHDTLPPCVVARRQGAPVAYHTECYEEARDKDAA